MAGDGRGIHVHLGTGSLGLGLIAPVCHNAGLRVVLVNRSRKDFHERIKEDRSYLFRIHGSTQSHDVVQVDDLLYFDTGREALIDLVAQPSTVILTTALKDGLDEQVPLIEEALEARRAREAPKPLWDNRSSARFLGWFGSDGTLFELCAWAENPGNSTENG